jgi:dihydrofolate synthase/folylpolyglutamate synthase
VAVIEAGLGGRLDATAVISSEVQVLTSIGREHTELLGDTASAILKEKAAIVPRKGRLVVGRLDQELKAELREICAGREAACHFLGDDIVILADPRAESFDVFALYGSYPDLRLRVLGGYQRDNAAVALAAAELFMGGKLDAASAREALASTMVPGRLEIISTQPLCIFDGSHNPQGMEETMRALDQILERRRLIAVVSILRDKGVAEMLRDLAPRCDILFATQNSNPRSYSADELAEIAGAIENGPEVFVDPDPREALRSAYRLATSNQVVLVTGSLYLISDLKRSLGAE